MRVRVRRGEEGIGRGWASFHAAGTGKNSRDKSRARLPAPERHLHPLQIIPWMEGERVEEEKKWGERVAEIIWRKRFPDYYGFLFFSLILYLLFAVFSAITVHQPLSHLCSIPFLYSSR